VSRTYSSPSEKAVFDNLIMIGIYFFARANKANLGKALKAGSQQCSKAKDFDHFHG
jgi:hypothetical protein